MAEERLLSEHEAHAGMDTTPPVGYSPTDEEKKTIRLVEYLFQKAKRHRKNYDEKWPDYYKMFRGKQWKEARPSYRHSEVVNMIFQTIQSTVPIQTDARPKINFLPTDPTDLPFAEILNKVSDSDWERNNWSEILTESVYDSNIYGTAFGSMEVEAEGDNGLPKICYEAPDPLYCYPDPNARKVNERRSRYFIYAEPVDVSALKRQYKDKKDFFIPDLTDALENDRFEVNNAEYKSPSDVRSPYPMGESKGGARDRALKITCWMLSDDYEEEKKEKNDPESGAPLIDPLTGQPQVEFVQTLKYPKGRKIVIACGVLCEDVENPYAHGKFPIARLVNYALPREFWGISEVEQLEGPQRIFNKIVSFMLDIMTLMGNPIWVVKQGSGVDTDNLVNRPGLIIEPTDAGDVRREQGLEINPSLFQLVDRMRSWFNDIGGSQDITRGAKPEGVSAASAINSLQEAAQTRLRLKGRHLDAHIQELGQLYASNVLQFYSAPKVHRLTNADGVPQFFKMHIETRPDPLDPTAEPKRVAVVREYVSNPMTGALSEDVQAKEYQVKADFDVRVTTGSSLPFAKQEKFAQAKEMFQLGVIDPQALFEAADWPNWQAIVARMEAKAAEQAQMQAAQAQMAPPPGMDGPPPPGPGPATPADSGMPPMPPAA